MSPGALARLIRRAPESRCTCDLCAEPIPGGHRHLLDVHDHTALCACRACSLLFQRDATGQGRYRLIPDRRMRLTGFSPASLGVPVGLAFFVKRTDGRVVAHYPSPAGATRWEIEPAAWETATGGRADLAGLAADVEALLVNLSTVRGRTEAWLLPIDDCYRLVALVRGNWTGMTGGDRVWPEIERFFDELRRCHGTDPDR